MTRIIFIGATGTDIGKTYVTIMLLHQLQHQGYKVRAIKPVISGFDRHDIAPSDSGLLLKAMRDDVTLENITVISPWRYRAALPPHLAAEQQGRPIILDQVVDFCQRQASPNLDFLLIEGVGGIMTPLNYQDTTLDLVARLKCHCLMVSGSTLGTLSHSLSALACIQQRDVILDGLIISESLQNYTDFATVINDFRKLMPHIPLRAINRDPSFPDIFTLVS